MSTFNAIARVQITLEIDAGSSWGPDCTVSQVHSQASRESVQRLKNILAAAKTRATIIGEPKVITVMHGEIQDERR
jgi:hypothetical protein